MRKSRLENKPTGEDGSRASGRSSAPAVRWPINGASATPDVEQGLVATPVVEQKSSKIMKKMKKKKKKVYILSISIDLFIEHWSGLG